MRSPATWSTAPERRTEVLLSLGRGHRRHLLADEGDPGLLKIKEW